MTRKERIGEILGEIILVLGITAVVLIGFSGGCQVAKAETISVEVAYPKNLYKGLIGEAVSEGYKGMYAVACCYRNRLKAGLSLGCVALKRKDLDAFVVRQGKKYEKMAKEIVRRVFEENAPDITNGATHYENIEAFGIPYWAKNMRIVARQGRHSFYASIR